jgi:hypothetical protein
MIFSHQNNSCYFLRTLSLSVDLKMILLPMPRTLRCSSMCGLELTYGVEVLRLAQIIIGFQSNRSLLHSIAAVSTYFYSDTPSRWMKIYLNLRNHRDLHVISNQNHESNLEYIYEVLCRVVCF